MRCDFLGDIEPCGINKKIPTMEKAGEMVGLDLTKPIDCSQMDVYNISSEVDYGNTSYDQVKIKRNCVLHAFVFNDQGEREELTITFELLSQRLPKPKEEKV